MADTLTPNYKWVQPEVGGDAAVWGSTLNSDLAAIDAEVYANQQAITAGVAPIGSITMFGGATPPANWLLCNGQTLDTSVTPAYLPLFNVIGNAFNTALTGTQFAVPNLSAAFPLGVGSSNALASTGGAASVTLTQAQLPAHTHSVSATQTPHTHSGSSPPHSHAIRANAEDLGHTHTTNVVFGSGTEIQSGTGWGQHNVNTGSSYTGITGTNVATASVGISSDNANITVSPNTGSVGGGAAIPALPPYVAINFIIRYQ